ncbi:MAG: Crp/Fnr family transcriptional regulator [Hyphomicrobium sp.]|jgi:CRP-like cAMP-binding protein|nr:Crp/Fnr family transcriptional regulator [Hyphomicrobium sp.]
MVARNEALDALAKAPLFGTLDETGRAAVAQELREASFDSGQNIFSRGDPGTELHIVIKGRVRLSVLTSDGRELSFAHVEPPSIFGELAVFDGRPRSADATAVNKVQTLTLSKAAFSRLLGERPQVAEAAVRFLSARLRDADEQLEAIALHPIEARLARFFLAAARQKDPNGKSERVSVSLPISQSELALLVGASRPKVNAALALLEAEGAIERKGAIVVCDIVALTGLGAVD